MVNLNELKRNLAQYRLFLDEINNSVTILNNSIDTLENSNTGMKSYLIDGISADDGIINREINELLEKKKFLRDTIIPEINKKIMKLKKEIKEFE